MSIIALLLLVALMIPVLGILIDSPLGRALARRVEGTAAVPPGVAELAKKVELLEAEFDDLSRTVRSLEEENRFLQRLITEQPSRATLPPPPAP